MVNVKKTFIDRAIEFISPKMAMERYKSKFQLEILERNNYIGASKTRQSLKNWLTSTGSPDTDDLPDLEILRQRSRDLYRNDGIVTGAIETIDVSAIGVGLRPQAQIDYEYLGLSEEEAEAWEKSAEREFNFVAKSINADASRTQNFYQMQSTAFISQLISGDVFALLPQIKRSYFPYKTCIALIEADRVSNANDEADSDFLAGGIKVNEYGEPIEYHILKNHPGGYSIRDEWIKIPAFGKESGRRNVIHVFKKVRPGQKRGIPILAPVLTSLKQLRDYTEAELTAALVSGLFTVFIKTETGELPPPSEDESDNISLNPGGVVGLLPGEDIVTANPNRPNTAYDPFTTAILRQVGAGIGVPYEFLIKHFTSSYTAARAAFLEAWRIYRKRRYDFAQQFCQPFWEAVIEEAVIMGRLKAPGFLEDPFVRMAYLGVSWNGPSAGQINEKVETEAAAKRVEERFSTREIEAAMINGSDFEHNVRKSKRENRLIVESTPEELRGGKNWRKNV